MKQTNLKTKFKNYYNGLRNKLFNINYSKLISFLVIGILLKYLFFNDITLHTENVYILFWYFFAFHMLKLYLKDVNAFVLVLGIILFITSISILSIQPGLIPVSGLISIIVFTLFIITMSIKDTYIKIILALILTSISILLVSMFPYFSNYNLAFIIPYIWSIAELNVIDEAGNLRLPNIYNTDDPSSSKSGKGKGKGKAIAQPSSSSSSPTPNPSPKLNQEIIRKQTLGSKKVNIPSNIKENPSAVIKREISSSPDEGPSNRYKRERGLSPSQGPSNRIKRQTSLTPNYPFITLQEAEVLRDRNMARLIAEAERSRQWDMQRLNEESNRIRENETFNRAITARGLNNSRLDDYVNRNIVNPVVIPDAEGIANRGFDPNGINTPYLTHIINLIEQSKTGNSLVDFPNLDANGSRFLAAVLRHIRPEVYSNTSTSSGNINNFTLETIRKMKRLP